MRPMDRKRFVQIMRNQARELRKPYEERNEDFEEDSVAFTLEWAAQLIVKYGPELLPEFQGKSTKLPITELRGKP